MKNQGQLYMIHSNYLGDDGVTIEPLERSEVFSYFDRFFVAELSSNEELLQRWVAGSKVDVLTGQ